MLSCAHASAHSTNWKSDAPCSTCSRLRDPLGSVRVSAFRKPSTQSPYVEEVETVRQGVVFAIVGSAFSADLAAVSLRECSVLTLIISRLGRTHAAEAGIANAAREKRLKRGRAKGRSGEGAHETSLPVEPVELPGLMERPAPRGAVASCTGHQVDAHMGPLKHSFPTGMVVGLEVESLEAAEDEADEI